MSYQPVERFMAGESLKKGEVVVLRGDYVFRGNVDKDFLFLGVVKEDCVMGEIVEVYILGTYMM